MGGLRLTGLFFRLFLPLVVLLAGCESISLPRLSFEDKPQPRLPVPVTYAFSPALATHTQTVDACGLPYSLPVGNLITQKFLEVGQERFNGVNAEPPVGQARGPQLDGYRVIVELEQFEFTPNDRSGDEDRYHAFLNIQLRTIYEDSRGTALAQSPLSYRENISLWTPEMSGQSSSCATGQIDAAIEEAAEILAKDMAGVIPRIVPTRPAGTPQPVRSPAAATVSPPTSTSSAMDSPPSSVTQPAVQFRTKLLDANQNLILEGGEVLRLLVETTNIGDSAIPSVYVELRGTPLLVKAFNQVTPLPVPLGKLKPGEKRTAEIRGRLPQIPKAMSGKLVIGVILSEGLPPGSHVIHTEIRPGPRKSRRTR